MANLVPVSTFDDVYQLDDNDDVQGGPGGIDNLQPQQLTNRTQYLNDILQPLNAGQLFYKTVTLPSSGGTYNPTSLEYGTLYTSASYSVQHVHLPAIGTVSDGMTYGFWASSQKFGSSGPLISRVELTASTGETIVGDVNNYITPTNVYNLFEGGVIIKKFPGATVWTIILKWGSAQTGTIALFPTDHACSAWLKCDGSSYNTASGITPYNELKQLLAYIYGGSGFLFNVPTLADPITNVSYYIHV